MMAASASGYTGTVAASITISVNGSSACGHPIAVTATVLDALGKPVAGQSVDWALVLTLSSGDKINKTPTKTNSNGVASTTVTLACVNGSRPVRASAGAVSAEAVLGVTARGLPRTSTVMPVSPARSDAALAGLLLAAIALAMGGLLMLRRLDSTRD
jgi:Bacterial Ig-like domain (group 1).